MVIFEYKKLFFRFSSLAFKSLDNTTRNIHLLLVINPGKKGGEFNIKALRYKKIIITGLLVASIGLFANTAYAAKPADNTRPGWGVGDPNHVHTGPPGLSNRPNISVRPHITPEDLEKIKKNTLNDVNAIVILVFDRLKSFFDIKFG